MAEQNIVATNSEPLRSPETSEHYNILTDNSSDSTYQDGERSGEPISVVIEAPNVTSPLHCENVAINEPPANLGDEAIHDNRVIDGRSPSYSTDYEFPEYDVLMSDEPAVIQERSSDTSLASIDILYYSIESQEYSRDSGEQYGTPLLTSTPRTPQALNYVLDRATPSTSRPHVQLRRRHLNFSDHELSYASDVDSESDEPAAKKIVLAEWIDDMEQLFCLREPVSLTTDDEE